MAVQRGGYRRSDNRLGGFGRKNSDRADSNEPSITEAFNHGAKNIDGPIPAVWAAPEDIPEIRLETPEIELEAPEIELETPIIRMENNDEAEPAVTEVPAPQVHEIKGNDKYSAVTVEGNTVTFKGSNKTPDTVLQHDPKNNDA